MADKNKKEAQRQPTNEEQIQRRQSGPRPTAEDWLRKKTAPAQQTDGTAEFVQTGPETVPPGGKLPDVGVSGYAVLDEVIKREDVQRAGQILLKYKQGKANLEARIVDNEQWYKMRHWGQLNDRKNDVEPTSGWLFNAIANKHADAMDNFPAPTVLPREADDRAEAKMLTSVIPVILDQLDFEQVYSDVWMYKLIAGTGVYGVFWDKDKLNGLGDVAITKVDLLTLFWEPGVTDVQRSHHLFSVTLIDNEDIEAMYPQTKGRLGSSTVDVAKYNYDDAVDTTGKSAVVDWYYKKRVGGKTVLHYVKYVNDVVLYATENDPQLRERGLYDHGLYPFVFDPLYNVEGSPAGFGYIDIGKSPQTYIDRIGKAVIENTLANTRPRFFTRADGAVNEKEYADQTQDFVHVNGAGLGEDSIRPIEGKPLASIYYEVMQGKIEELKETTGNRDVNTGGHTSGVTAASAIAAMQEAGGKLARDNSKAAYRAYRRMILMVIELIRQFYSLPRTFRILGENGAQEYVQFSNAGMVPQAVGMTFGLPEMEQMTRLPLYDVEVSAQRASPYSKLSQNEMALSFLNAGMFNPALADQALLCLDMMDFDRKDSVMQKIAQNAAQYQQQKMLMAAMAGVAGPGGPPAPDKKGAAKAAQNAGEDRNDGFGGLQARESRVTKKAREDTAERTAPR